MAEIGLNQAAVQAEVDNINKLATKVDEDARTLVAVAKKLVLKEFKE